MYLMGIDIGTTGCKVTVVDIDGNKISSSYREYSLRYPNKGWMELDPGEVYTATLSCIKECTTNCDSKHIRAVATASQGEAVIPVDNKGRHIFNAIVTFDNRNVKEYQLLKEKFDEQDIRRITGSPPHTMFSLPKIMWIKKNHPDIYYKSWKFMCFGDYIAYKLGGAPVMDYSLASRTMALDLKRKNWSEEILEKCGIQKEKLPEPIAPGVRIGRISGNLVDELDLTSEVMIISGGHDQACCALGAGVLSSGTAMDSLGTTESILSVDEHLPSPQLVAQNIPCDIYVIEGLYAYLSFLSSSGSILKWYRDNILKAEGSDIYKKYDKVILERFKKPSDLLILPHFAGSGTPYLDFESKGSIWGLTLDTDRYEIYKAIIEGTCMEAKLNIDYMEKSGILVEELRCIGGGANSDLWLQLKADITGKKVFAMSVNEAGSLGAALLAGIGSGLLDDVKLTVKRWVKKKKEYLPRPSLAAEYSQKYEKYKKIYDLAKNINSCKSW